MPPIEARSPMLFAALDGLCGDDQFSLLLVGLDSDRDALEDLAVHRGWAQERLGNFEKWSDKNSAEDLQSSIHGHQGIMNILQKELEIHQKIGRELDDQRNKVKSLQDEVRAQKNAGGGVQEGFGRLNGGSQLQVRSILDRLHAGGELTEGDARQLEFVGLGRGLSRDFFKKKGSGITERDTEKLGITHVRGAQNNLMEELERGNTPENIEAEARKTIQAIRESQELTVKVWDAIKSLTLEIESLNQDRKRRENQNAKGHNKKSSGRS